ncbi:MAG: hypothetical protein ACK4LQ_02130 [Pararhodobacter sp.]
MNAAHEPRSLGDENRELVDCLRRIANAAPTCGEEAQTAWSNRVWAGKFRDLQREARCTLRALGHDL